MSINIEKIKSKSEVQKFIHFPYELYKDDSYWIPPLLSDEIATFDPDKNPILKNSETALFLASEDDKILGRIAVIINFTAIEYNKSKKARFGWFDFIDREDVAHALLCAAEKWAKSKSMENIEGPMGFNNLDKAGLLIEGFEEISNITTLYNYPYYQNYILSAGYSAHTDWVEYRIKVPTHIPEKVARFSKLIAERHQLKSIKNNSKEEFLIYTKKLFQLMNKTHGDLQGYVPFDDDLMDHYAKKYIRIIKAEFTSIITNEYDEVVAFGFAIPSLSKAFLKARGKLFPVGWYQIRKAVRRNDVADLLLIGVAPKYQRKGVPAIIFNDIMQSFINHGIKYVESNPELETNHKVRVMMEKYEHRQHKRRRSFLKVL